MLPALLRRTRRPGIVAVAFAVLLPLSACGSSSGDGGDSGATTTLTVYSGRSGQFNKNFNPFTPTWLSRSSS